MEQHAQDLLNDQTIQQTADYFDIDEHLLEKHRTLEAKIISLKIKFEAHKISRSKLSNGQ